jgi:predicted nucleic acid-binding Zn ribbon protein
LLGAGLSDLNILGGLAGAMRLFMVAGALFIIAFVWLMGALTPKKQPETRCPSCGKVIKKGSTVCEWCGKELPAVQKIS